MDDDNKLRGTRKTSQAAYDSCHAAGALSKARTTVYDLLYVRPRTGAELDELLMLPGGRPAHAHQRLSELAARGLVAEAGEVLDAKSGKLVIVWDVTSNLYDPALERTLQAPKAAVWRAALQQLESLQPFEPALRQVVQWLRRKYPAIEPLAVETPATSSAAPAAAETPAAESPALVDESKILPAWLVAALDEETQS